MDRCPKCENTPIKFGEWCKGTNAFSYLCNSCKTQLKALPSTYVGFVITVLLAVATYIIASKYFDFSIARKGLAALLVIVPPAFLGAVIGYQFSGYKSPSKVA